MALPGVQVLFAFLLGVPFTQRFAEATDLQQDVYFFTFLCTAAATALLIAPSAYRLTWRQGDKEHLLVVSNRLTIAGTLFLAVAISSTVFVVTDLLFSTPGRRPHCSGDGRLLRLVLVRAAVGGGYATPNGALASAPAPGCPGVEKVLDLLDALHVPCLLLEVANQLRLLDLAAKDDDTVLGIDVDLALRHVGVAEDLGLDLARERDVVGLRLVRVLESS